LASLEKLTCASFPFSVIDPLTVKPCA